MAKRDTKVDGPAAPDAAPGTAGRNADRAGQAATDGGLGVAAEAAAQQGAGPGAGGQERAASLETELAAARAEADSWRDKAMRARADYDNLQKRVARDAQAERERNRARVLEGMLGVWDLAAAAAEQARSQEGPLSEAVGMLAREVARALEREGLARIGAVGERADPARHEVLASEPVPGVPSGHVSRVVAAGYTLDGKVLRFAKVCVAT